jgi:hypothetical protein
MVGVPQKTEFGFSAQIARALKISTDEILGLKEAKTGVVVRDRRFLKRLPAIDPCPSAKRTPCSPPSTACSAIRPADPHPSQHRPRRPPAVRAALNARTPRASGPGSRGAARRRATRAQPWTPTRARGSSPPHTAHRAGSYLVTRSKIRKDPAVPTWEPRFLDSTLPGVTCHPVTSRRASAVLVLTQPRLKREAVETPSRPDGEGSEG